jgi:hypothetical protein
MRSSSSSSPPCMSASTTACSPSSLAGDSSMLHFVTRLTSSRIKASQRTAESGSSSLAPISPQTETLTEPVVDHHRRRGPPQAPPSRPSSPPWSTSSPGARNRAVVPQSVPVELVSPAAGDTKFRRSSPFLAPPSSPACSAWVPLPSRVLGMLDNSLYRHRVWSPPCTAAYVARRSNSGDLFEVAPLPSGSPRCPGSKSHAHSPAGALQC